jgi:hypothetical protein
LRSALISLAHDLSPALIRRRAPLADVFDVAQTPGTDFMLIKPTHADAG